MRDLTDGIGKRLFICRDIIRTYYKGSNDYRSLNQGDEFETLSEDLTNGGVKGNVSYGTLTTIIESDLKFGLIYVGSDDGLIHVSRDGGFSWKNISENLQKNMCKQYISFRFKESRTLIIKRL